MLLSQEEIKQQTRELWRNNFSHSDEFLDIYFDEKYADENNLTIRHDGNVVASMQLLPYRYTFYGTVLRAGYLNGLCTDKNFRNRGYASNLIHATSLKSRNTGLFGRQSIVRTCHST